MTQTLDADARVAERRSARPVARYVGAAQALHWLSALLMFSVIPLGWVMTSLPEGTPIRPVLFDIHKSIGLTILALSILRILLKMRHPAPTLAGRLGQAELVLAKGSHVLFYVVLVAMPVSGYLISADGVHSVNYFGLVTLPHLPKDPAVEMVGTRLHLLGQWAVYALIVLHLGATAWHVAVRRDGILDRMLPRQDG